MDKFPHLTNIGRMVEDKENQIRNELYEIYFGKVLKVAIFFIMILCCSLKSDGQTQ